MLKAFGAHPWRFGALDYVVAAQAASSQRHRLKGRAVEASRDAGLTAAMRENQLLISEENVVAHLLQDLGQA